MSSIPFIPTEKNNNNSCIHLSGEKLKTFSFSLENQMEVNPNKAWRQCCIVANLLAETLQCQFKSVLCLISKPVSKITDSTCRAFPPCSKLFHEYQKTPQTFNHLLLPVSKISLHDEITKEKEEVFLLVIYWDEKVIREQLICGKLNLSIRKVSHTLAVIKQ